MYKITIFVAMHYIQMLFTDTKLLVHLNKCQQIKVHY